MRRVGDDKVLNVNVRMIAATNRNLTAEVREGTFRQDLLYRLDILRLYIPPLRDRRDDIYPLFLFYLKKYNKKFGRDIFGCSPGAKEMLERYPFLGNIRELRNITERLSVSADTDMIEESLMAEALYPQDVGMGDEILEEMESAEAASAAPVARVERTDFDKEKILYALKQAEGKKSRAAQLLGIDRTTLWRKMKSYHIE